MSDSLPDRLCSPCDHDGHTCAAFGCAQEVSGMGNIERTEADAPPIVRDVGGTAMSLWTTGANATDVLRVADMQRRASAHQGAVEDGVALRQKMRDAAKALRDGAPAADVVRLLDHHANGGQS